MRCEIRYLTPTFVLKAELGLVVFLEALVLLPLLLVLLQVGGQSLGLGADLVGPLYL